jgi:hypothetical protein
MMGRGLGRGGQSDWLNWLLAIGLPALVRFGGRAVQNRKSHALSYQKSNVDPEKLALRHQVQELRAELEAMKKRLAQLESHPPTE